MDVFDHFFSNMDRGWFPVAGTYRSEPSVEKEALRLPRTNIEEKENGYVFKLEMPGLSKKDIEVSVEDDKLTVKGERTEEKAEKNGEGDRVLRREIRSTRFERSFSLGNEIDQENIKARMEDGVLTVTLAKKAEKLGRKVDVS
jgi:HSP20 family protein